MHICNREVSLDPSTLLVELELQNTKFHVSMLVGVDFSHQAIVQI